jgi:endonuclease YncB( thermonuclease family)
LNFSRYPKGEVQFNRHIGLSMYNARLSRAALLAALLIAGPALATAQAQGDSPVEPGQTFTGTVVTVTDGDTYDLRRSIGGKVTIRLHGIDGEPS